MSLAGWVELLCVALLAFVIIGPKDLPKVFFVLGRLFQNLRRLSDQFIAEFDTIQHLNDVEEEQKKRQKKQER